MTESRTTPNVALLFADAELGAHLREALAALGAPIVHEGPAADVSRDVLTASGADVVVVNLEPVDEAHLDRVYDALEGGPYQVVFNDAEASRYLSGWDKARWARHLAAKLVGSGDVDPPRPAGARTVETVAAPPPEPTEPALDDAGGASGGTAGAVASGTPPDTGEVARDVVQSEQLEAELEALLADGESAPGTAGAAAESAQAPASPAVATDASAAKIDVEARQTLATPAPVSDWELVDFNAEPPAAPPREDARRFGIDKVNAEDYLKPDGGDHDSPLEPGLKLELVSLEASVAPTVSDEPVSEMMLAEGSGGIRRIVAVAAGADGVSEVGAFLAGLPTDLPALVLLVQHQRDQHAQELAAALDTTTRLPVRIACHDGLTRQGQVWLVPAGQACRLDHDGRIALAAADAPLGDPSIDRSLALLAEVFGSDVTVVVLAGPGHDALAGAQEVRDHGGQVWIQDPATCGDGAMAAAIHAEGLATFAGSPSELARHLCEAYA